jgi:5-methylcytosine-specific restriction endonuclease McrA
MNNFFEKDVSLEKCPALVLNADYRPLSYYPLSLWSWQDTVKSVFLDRVIIVSNYDRIIRSPSFNMQLPSVIALKDYIVPQTKPSFTRFNVFLRDKFPANIVGVMKNLLSIIYYQDQKEVKLIGIM